MSRPDRIVLSGATGFLGSHLLRALLADGHEVVILKRTTSDTWRIGDLIADIEAVDVDVEPMEYAFKGMHVDAVIHTACNYGRSSEKLSAIVETNVQFGLRLFEAAAASGVGVFYNAGTLSPKYLGAYSLSKYQFAEWVRLESHRIHAVNFRIEHMYGPLDDEKKFVPWFVRRLLSDTAEIKLTRGEQRRDFIHVEDVVSAFTHLLDKPPSASYAQFDVGTGTLTGMRKIVEMIRDIVAALEPGKKLPKLMFGAIPYREGDVMEPEIDVGPLCATGWVPKVPLSEGLPRVVQTLWERKGNSCVT